MVNSARRGAVPIHLLRLLAGLFLAVLLAAAAHADTCNRAAFGSWKQLHHKDTRERVLEKQAIGPLHYRTGSGGTILVTSGSWRDPYTGKKLIGVPASEVQIDHLIPVCWAWQHGASDWTRSKRRRFYNDTRFLVAVEAGINAFKGDKGPDRFLPLNRQYACDYLHSFSRGVQIYGLRLSRLEHGRIDSATKDACGPRQVARN